MSSLCRLAAAASIAVLAFAGAPAKVTTAVDSAAAAAAANQAHLSAATAHEVAVRSQSAVHEAIAALHLTQDALHEARADVDAGKVGHVIKGLEKEEARVEKNCQGVPCDDAKHWEKLRHLEARINRLQRQYNGQAYEARAAQDAEYSRQLQSIRQNIKVAEYQWSRALPSRIEIDTNVAPYPGAVETFGREDTAHGLTKSSIGESNAMVDSIERAQAVEGKRAVYRALTHLRGATITAYDGIAKSHMKNVEDYSKTNHWRTDHPVRHLAEEEADVGTWAFPVHGPPRGTIPVTVAESAAVAAPAPAAAADDDASDDDGDDDAAPAQAVPAPAAAATAEAAPAPAPVTAMIAAPPSNGGGMEIAGVRMG